MTGHPAPPRAAKERILEAAREAFRREGVAATPLDDIASIAGLARPHLYRYFANREALILEVIISEIRQVNAERWRHFTLTGPVRPIIVDSLILGHDLASEDFLGRVAFEREALTITADLLSREPSVLDAQSEYWGPVLEYGRARHEIAPHLTNEQIIRWFLAAHVGMAERPALIPEGDAHAWIRNFVVPPVVVGP